MWKTSKKPINPHPSNLAGECKHFTPHKSTWGGKCMGFICVLVCSTPGKIYLLREKQLQALTDTDKSWQYTWLTLRFYF